MTSSKRIWLKTLSLDELPEGRVKAVTCGHQTVCMSHFEGVYTALQNKCPHQGGPLGEGSIENGWLRCPWHGWDFHPITGESPEELDDGLETYPTEVRGDGVYVGLPEEAVHTRTSSDVMVETMVEWGVKHVFGMVGHSNLGFADALRRQEESGKLNFYGVRHEGAAAFAVSAYGKLTGRPAACFSIAGPGATNLLTGLWDAHVDRSPVLALTGQVPTKLIGRGAFQEVDLSAAFGSVASYTGVALSHSDYAELMNLACKHALLERGVSHIVLPDDMQTVPTPDVRRGTSVGRIADRAVHPSEPSLDEAYDLIRSASRPVIVVGHGARFSMDSVIQLAEALNCPVLTTFKGKGQIADSHPLGCGVLGRSGTPIASWFMNEADLLVVFGASFSNHTGISDYKKIIQVDYDPMALARFHSVTVPVLGEIGVTALALADRLSEPTSRDAAWVDQRPEIAERWAIWRKEKTRRLSETSELGLSSATVFSTLTRVAPENAIISVDVGNNTYSFGRYFECEAQSVLMSGYLGSIGFGFAGAMGAWAATQEDDVRFSGRPVMSVSGDGGFGQYMGELTTAAKYNMNITHLLLNNGELGKISKEQRAGDWDVWQTSLKNPSFAAFAEICGVKGIRVTEAEALGPALEAALAHDGPALVEVVTDALLL